MKTLFESSFMFFISNLSVYYPCFGVSSSRVVLRTFYVVTCKKQSVLCSHYINLISNMIGFGYITFIFWYVPVIQLSSVMLGVRFPIGF